MFRSYGHPHKVPLLEHFNDSSSASTSRSQSFSGDEGCYDEVLHVQKRTTALFSIDKVSIRLLSTIERTGKFFLPSFMHASAHKIKEYRQGPSPTQYLKGVRGLAAVCVYVQHFQVDYYGTVAHYGYRTKPEDNSIILLPFIRLPFAGGIYMVAIFFVLSGFALSYNPLKLIRSGKSSELLETLASAVFRRGLRLFIPCLIPILAAELLMYNGWWGAGGGSEEIWLEPASTPLAQVQDTLDCLKTLLNPFTWTEALIPPAPQLWTLPIEFRGSIIVYLCLLCLCKLKFTVRTTMLLAFAIYALQGNRWEVFLFIWGVMIAETNLRRQDTNCNQKELKGVRSSIPAPLRLVLNVFWAMTLVSGLYLGGWPVFDAEAAPGYSWICELTPGQSSMWRLFFWASVAAVQTTLALENLKVLQKPFTTRVAQYFGDISFSIYIVHYAVIFSLGRWLTPMAMRSTGSYNCGVAIGFVAVTAVTLWIADIHWRLCDRKAGIEFPKWIYMKILAEN